MRDFRKYEIWQKAIDIADRVYAICDKFPRYELFALCDQLRRAIVSVPSNIAEGSGRTSLKEQIHFIEIAYGSLMESYNQLIIAVDLKYIDDVSLDILRPDIDNVARMLNGLRNTYTK